MAEDGVMSYFAKIGLNAQDFIGGLSKSQSAALGFYRDVSVSMAATMLVFDKVMQYGQKFISLANQAAEFVSTIDRLSITTGLTNEQLQRFSNVARYADSDIGSLAVMVNKLQMNLNDQGAAGEQARNILDQMGVSYRNLDGSLKSANEIFPDTVEWLKNLSSSADRLTASTALVGRGYQELSGYIALGKDGIEEYYASANTLTDDQQRRLRDYEKSVKDLDATMQTLNYTVGTNLSGSFREWAELMNSTADVGGPVDTFFKNLDGFLTAAARGFHILGQEIKGTFQNLTLDFEGAKKTFSDLASWIQAEQTQDALALSGYFDGAVWDATMQKWVESTKAAAEQVKLNLTDAANTLDVKVVAPKTSSSYEWDSSAVVGSAGSEMYSFLMSEMAKGVEYEKALSNWMTGTPTRTDIEGTLGAEGAETSMVDQISNDLDKTQEAYESGYTTIEQTTLKHWKAMQEIARIAMQKNMDDWADTVNFTNSNVAYAQTITMTDGVANAVPIDFGTIEAPTLTAADFTGVQLSGGGSSNQGAASAGAGGSSVQVTIINDVAVTSDVAVAASEGIAANVTVNGGTAGL